MSEQRNNFDLATLAESFDLECKAAQGRDGKGELPEDFWKSYSAMANADGGLILLGVQEKPRELCAAFWPSGWRTHAMSVCSKALISAIWTCTRCRRIAIALRP